MNYREEAAPLLNSLTFAEMEALNEAGQGWDLLFRQLGRGSLNAHMDQVTTPSIDVVHLTMGNSVHQTGTSRTGYQNFAVVQPGCPDYQWCGRPVGAGHIMSFDPVNGYESISPAGFSAFSVGFEENLLLDVAEAMKVAPEIFGQLGLAQIPGEPRVSYFLAALVDRMNNLCRRPSDAVAWTQEAERQICEDFVLMVASDDNSVRAAPLRQRAKLLHWTVNYIEEQAHEAVSVSELCAAAGVSVRTLERSFKESLGITPRAVIKKVRLEGVRRALSQFDAEVPIHEVAGTWGFWHMGDFARDYLREYGELPREVRK